MIIERNLPYVREADKLNMHISELAYAYLGRDWNCPDGRAAFCRVYFVTSGRGELHFGTRAVSLLPGNIYIIPPGLSYSYYCEDSLEKLYCHLNLYCYNRTDLLAGLRECVVFEDRGEEIASIMRFWRAGDVMGALQLKELLFRTVCEALDLSGAPAGEVRTYTPLIRQTVSYIEKNLRADLTAAEIAASLFVSESRLQKLFRREMGDSIGKYITARVLSVAEEQLRRTGRPIREISDALGFCDRFYFSRLFSARYGIAPAQYRKHISP